MQKDLGEMTTQYMSWVSARLPRIADKYRDPITGLFEEKTCIPASHKMAITGTMAPVLLGLSPWKTKQELYNEIVNIEDPEIDEEKRFTFELGHNCESMIAKEFAKYSHIQVREGKTDRDLTRLWSMAQIDFLTIDGCPLEIKTASHADGWGTGCLFNEKGDVYRVDSKIPAYYNAQIQKQMQVARRDQAWCAVWLTFERGIRIFKIERDEELIQKIIDAEDDFLFNHVIPEVPYEEAPEPLKTVPPEQKENACFASVEFEELLKRYRELKAPYLSVPAKVKKEMGEIQAKLKAFMAGAKYAINADGKELCHFTESIGKPYFDQEAFSNEHPDLYAQYMRDGKKTTKFFLAKGE